MAYTEDNIFFKAINEDTPVTEQSGVRVKYREITLEFRVLMEKDKDHVASAPITKAVMEKALLNEDALLSYAMVNTPRLFPAKRETLQNVMMGLMAGEAFPGSVSDQIQVLSNDMGFWGATAMVYPGECQKYAEEVNSDVVILPSSIHEVLLMPYDGDESSLKDFSDMVKSVNETCVDAADKLADRVYLYRKDKDRVERA